MKHYFDFLVEFGCGIPKITLKGTVKDWKNLKKKVEKLQAMNVDGCLHLDW